MYLFPKEKSMRGPFGLSASLLPWGINIFFYPSATYQKCGFYCAGGRAYLVFVQYLLKILIFFRFFCLILFTEERERYFCEKKVVTSRFTGKKSDFNFWNFFLFLFGKIPYALLWGLALAITTEREARSC